MNRCALDKISVSSLHIHHGEWFNYILVSYLNTLHDSSKSGELCSHFGELVLVIFWSKFILLSSDTKLHGSTIGRPNLPRPQRHLQVCLCWCTNTTSFLGENPTTRGWCKRSVRGICYSAKSQVRITFFISCTSFPRMVISFFCCLHLEC